MAGARPVRGDHVRMSIAGHQIGRTVASAVGFIPKINTDLLTGIGFAAMAALLALGVHLPLSDD